MKILHYFLGFPPYRTGGLTKYAVSLMNEQAEDGHSVIALWPGRMNVFRRVKITSHGSKGKVFSYELINPLPVSLDEGINDINAYTMSCDEHIYSDFLQKLKPDVIHIHTLMGLHREFIEVSKKLGIRMIYTTHDYFGICPRVILLKNGMPCNDDCECQACLECNANALTIRKIVIMQSSMYRLLKNTYIVKKIRKNHRSRFFEDEKKEKFSVKKNVNRKDYLKLRMYYIGMLKQIDFIHFNSQLTESIYKKYFVPNAGCVISLTHKDIKDNRLVNEWTYNKKLKITYLAPIKVYKGFNVLKDALDGLWVQGYRQFELNVYDTVREEAPYMLVKQVGYTYKELKKIFQNTDVLVVPSVWYETFGFTVLEALSYGVPVIVSDHVGAKDIIGNGGIVVTAGNVGELQKAILEFSEDTQRFLRNEIRNNIVIKDWRIFVDEIYLLYGKLQNSNNWN